MKSMKIMGQWLTIGAFCFTALLGCEDEQKKAEEQADKGNAYIKEQRKLQAELYTDYKFLVSETRVMAKSELTAQGIVGYTPACINEDDRPIIKTKLTRMVALSESIQNIIANEKVSYPGDPSIFEYRKQNANSMLEELPNIPNCVAGATEDSGTSSDYPWNWEKPMPDDPGADSTNITPTETTSEMLNRAYSEMEQYLKKLAEVNIGIFRNQDMTLDNLRSENGFSFLDKPKCLSLNEGVTAESDLAMVEAKISIINTLLSVDDNVDFEGDLDQLPTILKNVQVYQKFLPEIPVCE